MKKVFTLLFFTLMATISFAQITWNIKAGMNISSYLNNDDADPKIGFRTGGGMEYAFNKTWSIQPSLLFTTKGATSSDSGVDETINQMYLELPIMGAARFKVGGSTNIVISAGPYFAYGIAGKTKVKQNSISVDWDTFKDNSTLGWNGLNRFDAGIGVGVAVELGKFVIGLDTQFGLADVADVDDSPKNMNVSIGLGYKF